jgi:hypothetical protein
MHRVIDFLVIDHIKQAEHLREPAIVTNDRGERARLGHEVWSENESSLTLERSRKLVFVVT